MKTLAAFAIAALASPAAIAAATVGAPAPGFTVADLTGKPVNLADYKGKTVVLEWHNFGCPFVQKHYRSGNMQALQKKYANDVVWLAVNSTNKSAWDYTAPEKLTAQLKDFGAAPARYLMDEPGTMGHAYGAKTTPHMFIIDDKGVLVYAGAIDDKSGTSQGEVATAKNYILAAYDEAKSGKPVTTASTAPYGCSVKYKD